VCDSEAKSWECGIDSTQSKSSIDLIQKHFEDSWFWDGANSPQIVLPCNFSVLVPKIYLGIVGENLNCMEESTGVCDLTGFTINTDIWNFIMLDLPQWP